MRRAQPRTSRPTFWTGLLRSTLALGLCLATQALGEQPTSQRGREGDCSHRLRESAFDADIRAAVHEVAAVWPIPPSFIRAVIRQESDFNPSALSRAGAVGLMQVLPSNAQRLGLTPQALWRPADNILAGTRLLAVLLKHYQGDVISALVAYNGRPRPRFAPLPNNSETPRYVRSVLRFWTSFERCEARTTSPIKPLVHPARLFGYPDSTPA
jgi:soluble lytic murein transglycosylase-like protein